MPFISSDSSIPEIFSSRLGDLTLKDQKTCAENQNIYSSITNGKDNGWISIDQPNFFEAGLSGWN